MEKKGTKLYCMPLVPFLYWMFRQQILAAAAPKAVGAAVLQAAGAGAAAAGAGNAAGVSAGAGAGTGTGAVSYTHLDVYKRQRWKPPGSTDIRWF